MTSIEEVQEDPAPTPIPDEDPIDTSPVTYEVLHTIPVGHLATLSGEFPWTITFPPDLTASFATGKLRLSTTDAQVDVPQENALIVFPGGQTLNALHVYAAALEVAAIPVSGTTADKARVHEYARLGRPYLA